MKNIIGAAILALLMAVSVSAHTEGDVQGIVKDAVQTIRTEATQLRKEAVDQFKAKREEAKVQLKAKTEELKANVKTKREEVKSRIEAKKVELKEKLKAVRDEKKKQIVERVYNSVNELNERMTDHLTKTLNQIQEVLDRVESRADKAEANDLDVASVRTAITAAESAIASSRSAVEAQAGKTYSFTVTTEEKLRSDVGTARQALHTDLVAVRETVKAARDAVKSAAVVLGQVPKVDEAEVDSED
ncbi:MAG: hypothetical protein Q8O97_00225 [bacterium]|nr:hypothetical protein [bacterium]